MNAKLRTAACLVLMIVLSLAGPGFARASDKGDAGKSMKKAGESIKKFGKKVGAAGKEAGKEIADASRKVFYKGKKVSARLLKRTQSATRDWWEETIDAREKTLRELRAENKRLKRQLRESE